MASNKLKWTGGMHVNQTELSKFLSVNKRTLGIWQKEEKFPVLLAGKVGSGNVYDTAQVIGWLIERELRQYAQPESSETGGEQRYNYNNEKGRLAKLQADEKQISINVALSKLLPIDVVLPMCQNVINSAKAQLLGVHVDVKSRYPELDYEIIETIEELITQALQTLGEEGVPEQLKDYMEKSAENIGKADAK